MSPDELDKANRFYFPKDRLAFVVSHGALRALLEAAAYAVAVAANWRVLSEEIRRREPSTRLAECPTPTGVVVAAPERYWEEWDRWSTTGRGVPPETRSSLGAVAEALCHAGIPSTYVSLSYGEWSGKTALPSEDVEFAIVQPWASAPEART